MAAVPSIGRANRVERPVAPGADAATELYERFSAQLFGYCFHQLGSREEAEDAVQTTFMNAFRGLARGIVPEAEQAWLFKIAHNVCLSRRRSSWRRGRIEAPNNMEVLQEVVPAKEKVGDELIRLQDVLEEMPDNQRRAILLREWQGLSYREIAHELELSQAAVETLIFRARRGLASGLEEARAAGSWRKRLRRGADIGGSLAFLKAMVGGGGAAAVKIATVVALTGAAVATTAADHMRSQHRAPAKDPAPVAPRAVKDVTAAKPAAAVPDVAARPRDTQRHAAARPLQRRSQPRPRRTRPAPPAEPAAKPPRPPRPPAAPAAASAPAPAVGQEQAPAPAAPQPDPPSAPKTHGNHAKPAAPAPAAPAPVKDNPGKGHDKDPAAPPQPPTEPAASETPADPAAHGPDAAPGQQDKGDKDNGGSGSGKGK